MNRILRIGIITVSVVSAMVLLLRLPISPSSKVFPVESIPMHMASITLVPPPPVASQDQRVVDEVRDVPIEDSVPADDQEAIQPVQVQSDRLQTIGENSSFMADVDIAVVQDHHTSQHQTAQPHLAQPYVSLDQVTEAPQFDHRLLARRIIYPPGAKRQGIEATVLLRLFIASDGTIEDIVVEEDPGYGFGEAALHAFTDVSVIPATIDGKAVAVTMLFPITFSLT